MICRADLEGLRGEFCRNWLRVQSMKKSGRTVNNEERVFVSAE
jgi:hypothetical protein